MEKPVQVKLMLTCINTYLSFIINNLRSISNMSLSHNTTLGTFVYLFYKFYYILYYSLYLLFFIDNLSCSSGYSSQSQKKRLLAKVQSECNMINVATKPEPGVEYIAPHPCHAPACKEPPTYQV